MAGVDSTAEDAVFQSTLSLRRATTIRSLACPLVAHFNPRSPCGERRKDARWLATYTEFQSTLSLRRATITDGMRVANALFQSTLSLRRATNHRGRRGVHHPISIHALLAESDLPCRLRCNPVADFNPRSPCGERRSTRRDTGPGQSISIHALLAESD